MQTRILHLFTRTPLHVGAGASVGAIDQPIQRERHTGFPVIPASSLKGSFADQWPATHDNGKGAKQRIATEDKPKADGTIVKVLREADECAWLFGSDTTDLPFAGSLLFSEARLLAFPIRSARGSYAWITCPLMLQRAARDGVFSGGASEEINYLNEPEDMESEAYAIFREDPLGLGADKRRLVLEEYCFTRDRSAFPEDTAQALAVLVPKGDLFRSITKRLVILSNGMMSHFATTACEIAQHVRISDETGTAEPGGLFNQENLPADSLFYSVLNATKSRVPSGTFHGKPADEALDVFAARVTEEIVFQFGGDASTGLGFCTATLCPRKGA